MTTTNRRGEIIVTWQRFVLIAVLCALTGMLTITTILATSAMDTANRNSASLSSQGKQINQDEAAIKVLRAGYAAASSDIQDLTNQVSSLNQSSDPLSAYNQICSQDQTNNNTGVDQLFYFPCTADIIPSAG
jgi:peptidoglycan hydrolase CwlO-like protein